MSSTTSDSKDYSASRLAKKQDEFDATMRRIDEVLHRNGQHNAVQFELAALANAAPIVLTSLPDTSFKILQGAIAALDCEPPNLIFSQESRRALSLAIDEANPNKLWSRLIYGLLSGGLLAAAAVCAIYFSSTMLLELLPNPVGIFWLVVTAFLGSITRLTTRVGSAELRQISEISPFFTGISGPLVGISIAFFVYSVFKSGLIKIGGLEFFGVAEIHSTIILGFICGYVFCRSIEPAHKASAQGDLPPAEIKIDRPNPFHMAAEQAAARLQSPVYRSSNPPAVPPTTSSMGIEITRSSDYRPPRGSD